MLDLHPYTKGKHGQAVICRSDLAIYQETWSRAYRYGLAQGAEYEMIVYCFIMHEVGVSNDDSRCQV